MFHLDVGLVYRFVNQRFGEWFGKPPEEAVGRTVREEVGETTFAFVEPFLRSALAGERTEWEAWVEFPRGRRYVRTAYVPTLDAEGRVVGIDVLASDLSEARLAQEAVGRLNETLERRVEERTEALVRANRDLDQFAYSVAHDLRAPLRSVVSTSRILLEDTEDRLHPDEIDLLRRQAASGVRLAQIVDDLLGFARLAQAEPRRSGFDMTALARAVAEQVGAARGSSCVVDVQEGMVAEGDPSLVGYVLTNLLDNALKYSPDGGAVTVGEDGGAFFVLDQGVGFDMAHAGKLFVAFERLVGRDEFEGTGVGLANVRRIVEKHGGRVWAESEPGKGSTFWFTLA